MIATNKSKEEILLNPTNTQNLLTNSRSLENNSDHFQLIHEILSSYNPRQTWQALEQLLLFSMKPKNRQDYL